MCLILSMSVVVNGWWKRRKPASGLGATGFSGIQVAISLLAWRKVAGTQFGVKQFLRQMQKS
jgi:hypothetical protein